MLTRVLAHASPRSGGHILLKFGVFKLELAVGRTLLAGWQHLPHLREAGGGLLR